MWYCHTFFIDDSFLEVKGYLNKKGTNSVILDSTEYSTRAIWHWQRKSIPTCPWLVNILTAWRKTYQNWKHFISIPLCQCSLKGIIPFFLLVYEFWSIFWPTLSTLCFSPISHYHNRFFCYWMTLYSPAVIMWNVEGSKV